ncbi:MAG: TRAP transporter large permease [Planctomycetota bacterium]|jgi:tripartite ATP-independent transporter DctM subunit|nr:TRAP transporter large permease [Planctomycetota bacterium]
MLDSVAVSSVVLLACMFLKVPVFASLIIGSLCYFALPPGASTQIIAQRFTSGIESIPLLAVPFYIFAGVVMNYCGITSRIMDCCAVLTGRLPGGLAQANILLSTLMGGLSGSNLADAAMEAKMLVPAMERNGMPKPFSTVVTAFSSIITPLIPPGIQMILYGTLAGVSIGKLFISGLSVGLLTCLALMIGTAFIANKRGFRRLRATRATGAEFFAAFWRAALPLCLPIVIIGSIRIGVCTPTEAGAVAVVYGIGLGMLYRTLSLRDFLASVKETVATTGVIALIVGAASVFAWILTKERIPQIAAETMAMGIKNKYVFLVIVNLFLLVVGMFIEGTAATIILAPLLAPVARTFGMDDVHFAFIFIFNLSIGCITPPMGTLMFVTCGITGCKIKDFLKDSIPYFAMLLTILALLTFVPFLSVGILDLFY